MKLTIALRHIATGDSYATLGIGISCCYMTQGDSKLHPWLKCLSIVGVFFFNVGGDAYKRFVKHGWGDSQEVEEGLLII